MMTNVKANGAYAVNKALRLVIKSQFGNVTVKGRKYSETSTSSAANPNKNWRYKWYRVAPSEIQKMSKIKEYVDTIAPSVEATTGINVRCEWKQSRGATSMLLVTKDVKPTPIRNRKK
jgi:hypothetical protein